MCRLPARRQALWGVGSGGGQTQQPHSTGWNLGWLNFDGGGVKPWWGDKKGACKSQGVAGTAGVGAVWGQDPAAQVSLGCGPKPGRAPGCSGNNGVLALFQLQNLLCPSHYIRQMKLARSKGLCLPKTCPMCCACHISNSPAQYRQPALRWILHNTQTSTICVNLGGRKCRYDDVQMPDKVFVSSAWC